MSEFNEFEAVSAGRIVGGDFGRRRIMRERTHFLLLKRLGLAVQSVAQNACKVLAFFNVRRRYYARFVSVLGISRNG
jgi:hypothetical protein